MKNIYKLLFALILLSAFSACQKIIDKKDVLPPYASDGNAVTLTASTTTVASSVADSASTVLTLDWSNPKYATDSAHQKFIVEIDSSGRNFAKETTFEVDGPLTYSFTGQVLNNVLANFGFTAGQPFKIDIRVTSSYANNNEQHKSNVITVTVTPYLIPITLTPSSTNPIVLQISNGTGNAVSFTWGASPYGNDTITYALQVDNAGDNFAHPQSFKYGLALSATIKENDLNTAAINAGVLGGSAANLEFRIVSYIGTSYINQLGISNVTTINVTTYVQVPDNLYIIGDATPENPQWNNSALLAPSQQFTKIDAFSFGIIINLKPGGYLFLPEDQGLWTHKWGGATDGTESGGGTLLADGAVPGSNTPAPSTSGLYKIVVNFQTNRYTVTPVTIPANLYIIGDATPENPQWTNSSLLAPSQQFTPINSGSFGIIINLKPGGYLFLPEDQGLWTHKWGGATDGTEAGGGTLLADNAVPGSNTPAPAATGLYKIIVNFVNNTYSVTPYTGMPLPTSIGLNTGLWIVGDATPGGWNNNSNPAPAGIGNQNFTQLSNAEYQINISLTSGKSYLLLPEDVGQWSNKYGGATDGTEAGGGTILFNNDVPSTNTPAPATTGNYTIDLNFITGKYTVH